MLLLLATLSFGQTVSAGGSGNDKGVAVAYDGSDAIYTVGSFGDTAFFGSKEDFLLSGGNQDAFLARYNDDGTVVWAEAMRGTLNALARDVAVGPNGNVYVVGEFQGTIFFDSLSLTSGNDFDLFLVCYTANGVPQWAVKGGGAEFMSGTAVTVNDAGQVFVGGFFTGRAGILNDTITAFGGNDLFLAQLDDQGNVNWLKRAGSTSDDYLSDLDTDAAGDVYATGFFRGALTMDAIVLTAAGGTSPDAYFIKVSRGGIGLWGRKYGASSIDEGVAISVDDQGVVHGAGNFRGTAAIAPDTLSSRGGTDIFVIRMDTANNFIDLKRAGGNQDDFVRSASAESNGNFFLCGKVATEADFGPINIDPAQGGDLFVCRYNDLGDIQWVKQSSGILYGLEMGIAAADVDRAYLTGGFREIANFGGNFIESEGDWDVFISGFEQTTSARPPSVEKTDMLVYPNPFKSGINLRWQAAEQEPVNIQLIDALGQAQWSTQVQGAQLATDHWLNLPDLPTGFYFLRLVTPSLQVTRPLIHR